MNSHAGPRSHKLRGLLRKSLPIAGLSHLASISGSLNNRNLNQAMRGGKTTMKPFLYYKKEDKNQELTCRAENAPFVSLNLASCTFRFPLFLEGSVELEQKERELGKEPPAAVPAAAPGILRLKSLWLAGDANGRYF